MTTPFTKVFGGSTVQPSDVSFAAYTLDVGTLSLVLSWPTLSNDNPFVMARILEITPSISGQSIDFPDARQVGPGTDALVRNMGSFSFTVADADGNPLAFAAPGQAVYLYLRDNSTEAGDWEAFTFGTGTSSADAATLAGAGHGVSAGRLININTPSNVAAGRNVTFADQAATLVWTGGAGTLTFDPAATLSSQFFCFITNQGSGSVTLDPNAAETIDGVASIQLAPLGSCIVTCTGILFATVGRSNTSSSFTPTYLNKNVAGGANVTLTATEAANLVIRVFGLLTANINLIMPAVVAEYFLRNDTTGAFSITVKTPAGTGIVLPQGSDKIYKCDATNISDAVTITGSSLTVPDGAVGAPGLPFASEVTSGVYRPAAGTFAITILGVEVGRFSAALLAITGSLTATGTVSQNGMDLTMAALVFG